MLSPAALEAEARAALHDVGRVLDIAQWPAVPVSWNRRLRRAGRAVIDNRGSAFRSAEIELSPTYFQVYPEDLRGILVHEAVHIGLAVLGRPFGHGNEFRRACTQAGGLLHSRWLPGRVYRYRCPVCRRFHERRRRVADSRWCADCVAAAEEAGDEAYTPARALQLVETAFCGPEPRDAAAQPVCESSAAAGDAASQPDCADSEAPLRYPVAEVGPGSPAVGEP